MPCSNRKRSACADQLVEARHETANFFETGFAGGLKLHWLSWCEAPGLQRCSQTMAPVAIVARGRTRSCFVTVVVDE